MTMLRRRRAIERPLEEDREGTRDALDRVLNPSETAGRQLAPFRRQLSGERIGTLADVVCAMRGVSYYSLAIRAGGANETNHR